jgi:nucleoside-diphosphate-sugar epimerase
MPPSLPCDPAQLDEFLSRPTDGAVETLQRHQGDLLIAGAGGKMGGTLSLMLARAAAAAGTPPRRIFAVSRFSNPASRALLENHGITTLSADLIDRQAVASLPDAPLVFFMAGQKFGTAHQPELTWAMNTVVPAIAAERWQNSRIVAFSTGCVYSMVPPDSGGSTEDSPTNPPGEYAHSCLGREGVFRFYSNRFNTPTALVRLNYSVECRYGVLTDIARRILDGQPVDVSSGWVNVIWQRDACAHAIQCLDAAASPAVPVNITGPHTLPVRELAAALAQRLGRSVHFSGSEHPTAWLNNASRSHARFGPPPTPLADMLDWTAAWLLHGAPTLGKPTHFEAADGRF